jgi:hypothetical protein
MKLTYEDCRELKDAGFPMKKLKDYDMTQCPFVWGHFDYNGESYIQPVLSELIEACGLQFMSLIAPCVYDENWVAWGSNYKEEGSRKNVRT